MGPVPGSERLETIDTLRGFALLGILLVNIALFSWPLFYEMVSRHAWVTRRDVVAEWLGQVLAEGKFYPLFSFLFGLGVSIQMERARKCETNCAGLLCRRLLVLLGFGLAHAFLLWEGDILVLYAVCGFLLLAFQERQPKTLLIWAGICLLLPVLLYALFCALLSVASLVPEVAKGIEAEFDKERASYQQLVQDNLRIFSQGTMAEIFGRRAKNVLAMWQFTWFFAPTFFGMFLLGMYAGQRRILHEIESHQRMIRRVLVWGLAVGLPANVVFAFASRTGDALEINFASVVAMAGSSLGGPALGLAYAAGLSLLMRHQRWRNNLRPIAAAGRMALTNYLMQSVICTTLCYSYGFGWYGSLGRAAGMGVAVVIYSAQVLWSLYWLKRFRFGPAEWLWRTLTYGKPQPMRLAPDLAAR